MVTIKRAIFSLGLAGVLCAGLASAAAAQEIIPVSSVTVTAARPGKADIVRLRKILDLGAASEQEIAEKHAVYIVKIFAHFQPAAAAAVLSIGTSVIPQYGTFAGGLFVSVYDPKKLSAFSGQPVKLIRKGPRGQEPAVDTSTLPRFPATPAVGVSPSLRKTVDEVLRDG